MNKQEYIDYIKLMLTADLLTLEIPDETIGKFVDQSLIEVSRYIDETRLATVNYERCIDLNKLRDASEGKFNCNTVVSIYRTEGFTGDNTTGATGSQIDPMYAQTWMVFSGAGGMYNFKNYCLNYMAYNTLLQIRNTTSTDLKFKQDKRSGKLYINTCYSNPEKITIEYVPVIKDVEEVLTDYWIDILKRLSLAMTKLGLGRVRTRYKQSNALWEQDGDTLIQEGNKELEELREVLRANSTYFYPVD